MTGKGKGKETSKSGGRQQVEAQVEEVETSERKRKGAVSQLIKEVFGPEEEENEDFNDGNQDDLDGNDEEKEMSEGHGSENGDAEEELSAHFSDGDGNDKESDSDYKKLYLDQKEYISQLEASRGRNGGHDVEIMLQQKVEHLEGAKLSFYTVKVFREFLLSMARKKYKVNLTDLIDGAGRVILEGKFLTENWITLDTLEAPWKEWSLKHLCEKLAKLYPEADSLVPADASLEDRLGKIKAKLGKSTETMDKYIAKIVEAYEAGSKPSDETRSVEVLIKGLKSLASGDRASTINMALAADLEQHPKPTTVLTFTHKAQMLHSKLRTAVALVTKYRVRVDFPIGKGNRALDDDSDTEEAPSKKGAGNQRFNALKERPKSGDDKPKRCDGCGRMGHVKKYCFMQLHADFNKEAVPFEKSATAAALLKSGQSNKELPTKKRADGSEYHMPKWTAPAGK